MKLKAILIGMLAIVVNMQAQTSAPTTPIFLNQGNISGKVIDKQNNEALPYVSITIREEGKVISGGITKDNVNFTISNLPFKTLQIELIFMGYKKYET